DDWAQPRLVVILEATMNHAVVPPRFEASAMAVVGEVERETVSPRLLNQVAVLVAVGEDVAESIVCGDEKAVTIVAVAYDFSAQIRVADRRLVNTRQPVITVLEEQEPIAVIGDGGQQVA